MALYFLPSQQELAKTPRLLSTQHKINVVWKRSLPLRRRLEEVQKVLDIHSDNTAGRKFRHPSAWRRALLVTGLSGAQVDSPLASSALE